MVSQLESKILRGENIQPSVSAAFTSQRPHLDGLNKEAIWQGQKVELDSGGTIQFAFDTDHLYVFVECPITDQGRDVSPRSIRQRDGVLDENRIQIELDVDRDLASAWRIQVDQIPSSSLPASVANPVGRRSWRCHCPNWFLVAKEPR